MICPTTHFIAPMHRCMDGCKKKLLVDPDPDLSVNVSGLATRGRPRLFAIFTIVTKCLFVCNLWPMHNTKNNGAY